MKNALEELQNKPRGKRTALEQCVVDAALLEEAERDGETELMAQAAYDLQTTIHALQKPSLYSWQMSYQSFGGTKIIVDKFCYTEKRTWRAVAVVIDVRRPNKVKPIYKKKLFIERKPRAYMVQGLGLVMHPEIYAAVQRKISESVIQQERRAIMSAFGIPDAPQPKGLMLSDLEDLIKRFR